jgi:hypothetical protein
MSDKYELVRFEKDGLTLDVNVYPSKDTVWLSLNEMCLLFGRDKSVISRHIKSIFKEGELDLNRVVAKNATTASGGKIYDMDAFNLQHGALTVKSDDSFHDRFIVIDGESLYHLGASLNYTGRKTFAISELTDERLVKSVIDRINAI